MDTLNYHHLYHFWIVAQQGSIAKASKTLQISQPTISTQIRSLETALRRSLFERSGRLWTLTPSGSLVFRYADDIFGKGKELLHLLKFNQQSPLVPPWKIGFSLELTSPMVMRLLNPVISTGNACKVVCKQSETTALVGPLTQGTLDCLVTTSLSLPNSADQSLECHLLAESGISFFSPLNLFPTRGSHHFPTSLSGKPFLLPTCARPLRLALEIWFEKQGISPQFVGEFDDSTLMATFAAQGHGCFAESSLIHEDILQHRTLTSLGTILDIKERYFVYTQAKSEKHPATCELLSQAVPIFVSH
jgi:LysR family transcriptional regulator, transcriptional activator of nhaA